MFGFKSVAKIQPLQSSQKRVCREKKAPIGGGGSDKYQN